MIKSSWCDWFLWLIDTSGNDMIHISCVLLIQHLIESNQPSFVPTALQQENKLSPFCCADNAQWVKTSFKTILLTRKTWYAYKSVDRSVCVPSFDFFFPSIVNHTTTRIIQFFSLNHTHSVSIYGLIRLGLVFVTFGIVCSKMRTWN